MIKQTNEEFYQWLNDQPRTDHPDRCYLCNYYVDMKLKCHDYCEKGKFFIPWEVDEETEKDPRCLLGDA